MAKLYEVTMQGEEVEWAHRESPAFYDEKGRRQKVVKPAEGRALLQAKNEDEARAVAIRMHPEYVKVSKVREL